MRLDKRYLPAMFALLAGCAAAAVTLFLPIGVMENFTASSGLSEIVPQTAPPLGTTARLAIAFVAAVVAAGIVLALLGNGGKPSRGSKETRPMPSAFPLRLPRFGGIRRSAQGETRNTAAGETSEGWFVRAKRRLDALAGRETDEHIGIREFDDLPKLRHADRHPDAPPRRPIRASADLRDPDDIAGTLDLALPSDAEDAGEQAEITPAPRPVPPARADDAAEGWRPLGTPLADDSEGNDPSDGAATNEEPVAAADGRPYAELDLGQLIDRLERRLRAQPREPLADTDAAFAGQDEDEPAGEPAAPVIEEPSDDDADDLPPLAPRPVRAVPDAAGDDMDEALRAALETLERMNRRSA